jgi:hypothetical protein
MIFAKKMEKWAILAQITTHLYSKKDHKISFQENRQYFRRKWARIA